MKKIICEVCGYPLIKDNDKFICENCGLEYSNRDVMDAINSNLINYAEEAKKGSTIFFGRYMQEKDASDEEKEAIEWRIIAKEQDKVLLISEKAIDCQPFNTECENVTWETCSLRKWLNNEFLNEAFTNDEQQKIFLTTVSANKNPKFNSNPGNDTQDKIFLLSIDEINKYFPKSKTRKCVPSAYALDKIFFASNQYSNGEGINCFWWLRTPGVNETYAARVNYDGSVYDYGHCVKSDNNAIRPALWMNIDRTNNVQKTK